jgi:hypothetical protein
MYGVNTPYIGYFKIKIKENMADIIRNTRIVSVNNEQYYHCNDDSNEGEGRYLTLKGEEVDISTLTQQSAGENSENLFAKTKSNVNVVAQLSNYYKKFVSLEEKSEYPLISILTIHSYLVDLFERTPYLWIQGEKGSGKTTLMTILKSLVYHPVFLSDTTPAALFRIINDNKPTVFLDEVEDLNKRNAGNKRIFQVMNSGYQRNGSVTIVSKNVPVIYKTFCFKVLAGINPLMSTLEDRCISMTMKQPAVGIKLESFAGENKDVTTPLINMIHASIRKICPEVEKYIKDPALLKIDPKIRLREYDKWLPILAIAKSLSTDTNNYFDQIHNYALDTISRKADAESRLPENICKEILKDFLKDQSAKSLVKDKNYFFFKTEEIQKVIQANDQYNTYRNKSDITLILKKIGIETDRKRFGSGPVSLYKIPKSILN